MPSGMTHTNGSPGFPGRFKLEMEKQIFWSPIKSMAIFVLRSKVVV